MTFGTYQRLDVHVMASSREVIRAARGKLTSPVIRQRLYRQWRHAFYRQMLKHHARERDLYRRVTGGLI